jgi:hypothetical protein
MITAPNRYKVFNIPKRDGRVREIAQPSPEVKLLQRVVSDLLLTKLPVHACATAYRKGTSLLANATPHSQNGPILKMDLKGFFPSLRSRDWVAYCNRTSCLKDEHDIFLTSRLLFRKPKGSSILQLAIGAPSSPTLSNVLMYEFDELVVEAIKDQNVTYTRYADDMTFSAPKSGYLNDIVKKVARIIRSLESPNLDINGDKTNYVTKKFRRSVTGLTLANDGRVTIGRDKKREIRAAIFRALKGQLPTPDLEILSGTLAYINSVEPTFLESMRSRYGINEVDSLLKKPRGKKLKFHIPPIAPNELSPDKVPKAGIAEWTPRKRWP